MKITNIETFIVDAGWRPWMFVKVETDEGITGWGECSDGRSPHGIEGTIRDMKPLLIGKDPRAFEMRFQDMYRITRQSPGGIAAKAIAGLGLRLHRHQGEGARHIGRRAVRRPHPREGARLLVPLRQFTSAPSRHPRRAADRLMAVHNRLGPRGQRPRLHRAEDEHHPAGPERHIRRRIQRRHRLHRPDSSQVANAPHREAHRHVPRCCR